MSDRWPPAELSGLAVSFGSYDTEAHDCRCGFNRIAEGAQDVAKLTAVVVVSHQNTCSRHTATRAAA